ncbi:kinesin KIF9 [Labeo rohita]|uniref:Kinesin-like protein n=1 Tax=Labeo rohita TaxID=84645 RepID=A0A498MDG7_LABRO|nr:kinesin KIF9 [Labeo rohita]
MSSQASPVKVYIRIRPTANFAHEIIECLPDQQTLKVRSRKDSKKGKRNNQLNSWVFQLNGVLHNVSQEDTYDRVARSVVLGAFGGYNGTIMCFGQTGAGKTYTMTGAAETYKQRGIIPRALQEVFQEVEQRADHTFSVHLSFLEIYNETMSRSRTLSDAKYITSKLNLVDLAGSERLSKTGSEGQVQTEAMYINKSLSFLEQVILALADSRREHVPFRQSKLTHALKDSLGGNCNTVLVANIYGEAAQIEETLSTLRFATRMKCVQTKPSINEHVDPVVQGSVCAVGEVESCGYGLGLANSSQRHQRGVSPKPSKARKDKQISSSPPPKAEAFEDFKAERGSEINRILKENKAVLSERTARLRTLTDVINATKRDLDYITYELRQFREQKQSQGQFVSAEGEPVLEEAELSLVMQLKELKNRYRQAYEEFRSTKTEVSYCQHLVNQCRTRLLTEFESWYNESFLLPDEVLSVLETGPARPGHIPVDKALTLRGSRQVSQSPESVRGSRSKTKLPPILSVI